MFILLTGATGLVGKELGKKLVAQGHSLRVLTRDKKKALESLPFPAQIFLWQDLDKALIGVDAIINLAGEPVASQRWSEQTKDKIRSSRVASTRMLVDAINKNPNLKINKFISASAIGFYGDRGSELLNEESVPGKDFLSLVCQQWEAEVLRLRSTPSVILRIGVVLSEKGGAIEKMLMPFSLGFGGKLASGKQWMSWIHLEDLVHLIIFCLEKKELTGVLNAVAPKPVQNKEFTSSLARALSVSARFPVPAWILKVFFGEMSYVLLASQNVSAKKIMSQGFRFQYTELSSALSGICRFFQNHQKLIFAEQWVPQTPEQVFPFFCDEKNLEILTPAFLNFKVENKSTQDIQDGTLINYTLKLHGLPVGWQTRIENWQPPSRFVDTQLKGPYSLWHHTHDFIPFAQGTMLRDQVLYKLPFGFLGSLVAGFKVVKDVNQIFAFRRHKIVEIFNSQDRN